MQVAVPSYPPSRAFIEALERLGYENLGEAGVPGRLYFCLRGKQAFNVHVVQASGEHWFNNIALREYLRHSPCARERYAQAKLAAVASGTTRLQAYSAAKSSIVASLLAQASGDQSAG